MILELMIILTPKKIILVLKDPVVSLIYPTMYGPKNPPRLPILLISAIAPAAAASVKKEGGIDQNGEYAPNAPHNATVKNTNDKTILVLATRLLMIIATALVVKHAAT